uniref:Tripartite tricarboxylate transporter substrate binding protein n=1 Tax=Anaerolinea thermolimosa TaxID=229919 RepID=A0A7C4KJW8_9CHLR
MIQKAGRAKKLFLCLGMFGFLVASGTTAFSQDYPTKAITMVVGMEAGGIVDVATRVLSDEAKKLIGQDIIVENRPGASHMVAGSHVVASKPDGYTLWGSTDAPFIRMPHMMKLKFDPISETTPIIFYGVFTHFLLVPAESQFKTLKDLLTYVKEHPGKLTFGIPGVGMVPHMAMASMEIETGLKVSFVPFAGEPKIIAALLGGHLMAAGIAVESSIAQVKAGKLRALAVLQGEQRLSAFPEIPTLKEGAKEFGMKTPVTFPGLMISGPKGLPEPVVKKLVTVFEDARKSAPFQKYAKETYIFQDNMPMVGEALRNHLARGYKETGELVEKLGLKKK